MVRRSSSEFAKKAHVKIKVKQEQTAISIIPESNAILNSWVGNHSLG